MRFLNFLLLFSFYGVGYGQLPRVGIFKSAPFGNQERAGWRTNYESNQTYDVNGSGYHNTRSPGSRPVSLECNCEPTEK